MNRWTHKWTEDYHLELETNEEGLMFIHIQIYKWSPSVYKELLAVYGRLEEILRDSGVDRVHGMLPQSNEEFASLFGFDLHNTYQGYTLVSKEI